MRTQKQDLSELVKNKGRKFKRNFNSYLSKTTKFTKKMVQVLPDFKANWREFYDHSYFRDLTRPSNQRRLGK